MDTVDLKSKWTANVLEQAEKQKKKKNNIFTTEIDFLLVDL